MIQEIVWYMIGEGGTRRHAFVPGHYEYAFCGRGPAYMTTDGSEPKCQRCDRLTREIKK